MKQKAYKSLINYAIANGCIVEYGSKHIKIFSPMRRLIYVFSGNGSKEPHFMRQQISKIARRLEHERTAL